MLKLTTLAAFALIALTSSAWAQTTTTEPSTGGSTTPTVPEVTQPVPETDSTNSTGVNTEETAGTTEWYKLQDGDLRASRLIGMSVRNTAGESIGDINEIVLQRNGKIGAVIVGVGGFLGMGEREVAIPFSSLKLAADSAGGTTLTVDATRDTLANAPAWQWAM